MTRDEMLNKIREVLYNNLDLDGGIAIGSTSEEILLAIEEAGMLPPTRYVFYTSDGGKVAGNYQYGTAINEWEIDEN